MNGARSGPAVRLTEAQKLDWLRLIRCENIGPRTFRFLLNRYGGAGAALEALPALIAAGWSGRKIKLASRSDAEREMEAALACGARFIALGESEYPASLRAIESPPPLIAARGYLPALQSSMAAIVGARNASAAGLAMAERLARGLGAAGYVVVSGLARGIDAQAHRAALTSGTVGVCAGGLDRPYPAEHAGLIEQMLEHGAAVSEMPFGWEPRGRDFPRRNRLVSGLALGTIVVEAARRSGSLITARFAREQNRELFAVPGSPLDPRAEGPNDLLREGAHVCASDQDVIEVLAPLVRRGALQYDLLLEAGRPEGGEPLWDEREASDADDSDEAPAPAGEPLDALLARLLGPSPVSVDDVVRVSGRPARDIRNALVELELQGRLARHGGDMVSLVETRP